MKYTIMAILRKCAAMVRTSAVTPEQVLKILGIFRELLADKANFIDYEKWGSKEDGKEIVPFSFSDKGLSRVSALKSYKPFEHVYRSGTGVKGEKYSLVFFLSQFLVASPLFIDSLDVRHVKKEDEKVHEKVREKLEPMTYRVDARALYRSIPEGKYTKERFESAQNKLLSVISNVEQAYKKLKNLTTEEERYVQSL